MIRPGASDSIRATAGCRVIGGFDPVTPTAYPTRGGGGPIGNLKEDLSCMNRNELSGSENRSRILSGLDGSDIGHGSIIKLRL